MLACYAYDVRADQLADLPDWAKDMHFHIEAKVAPEDVQVLKTLKDKDKQKLLQVLLAQRFGLKVHNESREGKIFELVVAKGGPKLKASVAKPNTSERPTVDGGVPSAGLSINYPGHIEASASPISSLATLLSQELQREVVDKTGLDGTYDISLKYRPNEQTDAGGQDDGSAGEQPNLMDALQEELGLKLQPARGPVQVVTVDAIHKPEAN